MSKLYRVVLISALAFTGCRGEAINKDISNLSRPPLIDVSLFNSNALVQEPTTVSCTLENGMEAECLNLVVKYLPDSLEIGPFCPAKLSDSGGIWHWSGEDAGLYRVDGEFLQFLDKLGYTFFDDLGNVYQSDISAAQPSQDHTCIHVAPNSSVNMTVLLPLNPVVATTPSALGTVSKVGLAINGTPIFADAPTIQSRGHMPALDTCGGHVDPGGWYHWHGNSKDIETVYDHEHVEADCHLSQEPTALFGFAFDGFPIYGSLEMNGAVPSGLDECGGHIGSVGTTILSYHYHTPNAFPNLPKCLVGVQARDNFSTTATNGVGAARPAGGGGRGPDQGLPPDFAEAAVKLGVSEEYLMTVLRDAGGRQLDFAKAAATLNVEEAILKEVLPTQRPRR